MPSNYQNQILSDYCISLFGYLRFSNLDFYRVTLHCVEMLIFILRLLIEALLFY